MSELKSKINPEVSRMAEIIKSHIVVDKTGSGTEKEPVFEKCLSEDLSIGQIKKVNDHNANFIAAGALAFGEASIAAMTEHRSLKDTSIQLKMAGRDHVDFKMDRTKDYQNHLTGDGNQVVTKHGVLYANYQVKGGHSSGQLKNVREILAEEAAKSLKK